MIRSRSGAIAWSGLAGALSTFLGLVVLSVGLRITNPYHGPRSDSELLFAWMAPFVAAAILPLLAIFILTVLSPINQRAFVLLVAVPIPFVFWAVFLWKDMGLGLYFLSGVGMASIIAFVTSGTKR